jgi:predicted nucleotidyltransferase
MLLQDLEKKSLIQPPAWLSHNTQLLTVMGSLAYGVSSDSSDYDVYGWCIPPQGIVFPHLNGLIPGFSKNIPKFDQWQQHHILDQSALAGKGREYDFQVFNVVKYFALCMENNPNMIDSLFVPQNCILHITQVGNIVRENRKLFLHKGLWPKYKGYSFSQLHKSLGKNPEEGSKRKELRDTYGMDTKFLYHVVRLLSEAEQMLATGDLDLQETGRREHMKAIRRGEVPEEEIRKWAADKEKQLEDLYHKSHLPWGPDENKIKQLLLNVLEHHYGSLEKCVTQPEKAVEALKQIAEIINTNHRLLYG